MIPTLKSPDAIRLASQIFVVDQQHQAILRYVVDQQHQAILRYVLGLYARGAAAW